MRVCALLRLQCLQLWRRSAVGRVWTFEYFRGRRPSGGAAVRGEARWKRRARLRPPPRPPPSPSKRVKLNFPVFPRDAPAPRPSLSKYTNVTFDGDLFFIFAASICGFSRGSFQWWRSNFPCRFEFGLFFLILSCGIFLSRYFYCLAVYTEADSRYVRLLIYARLWTRFVESWFSIHNSKVSYEM